MSDEKTPLQAAYVRLLDLHTESLLKHGGEVSQGVALAVKAVLELMPENERQAALVLWAEGMPGEVPEEVPSHQ